MHTPVACARAVRTVSRATIGDLRRPGEQVTVDVPDRSCSVNDGRGFVALRLFMQRDLHDDSTETLADSPRAEKKRRGQPVPERFGRYVILSELGRGGMSVVYVAYDPELDRRVALKVVSGTQLTKAHRARLHREAQALARLSHPSVVTVFDVGDIGDDTFVAMELIDGMSLRTWIETPRTWREVVRVVVAAGRGLAAAHAAGIVHRDVKPDNIVIATTGAVKLVDFGLARDLGDKTHDSGEKAHESGEHPLDDLELAAGSIDTARDGAVRDASGSGSMRPLSSITRVGNVVGTPAYMPPEARRRNGETDQRSDQFSLCATLYEALYRQKPFKISPSGMLRRAEQPTVADDPDTDARTLAAAPPKDTNVPAWLQRVVSRGLAVEPRRRFPSVDALLVELDREPARPRRRIAAAAAALVAVAGIATFATSQLMTSEKAAGPTCDTGDTRVAAVWNPARLAAMKQAASAKAPWAAGAVDAFGARVDQYGAEWKAMFQDACQATRVRLVQSAEALDLRMACLDRRLDALGALVTLMGDPKPGVLRRASETVASLPPVSDCADVKALRQVVRRPTDPAIAMRLGALDRGLARLQALYAVGDVTKAVALADELITDATNVGYAPLLAQALYWRGRALVDRGGGAEAEAMFDQTFAAALGAGEDQMAADAAARIAQEHLWSARVTDFERWQHISHALAERTNATGVLAFVDQLGCMANHWYGKPRTRLACLQALAKRVGKPNEWLVTTLGIAATEAGAPGEAIHWLEQGVVLARAENGDDHPRTLEMRAYLCNGLNEIGDYARSATECRDALARLKRSAPDDALLEARIQLYLGDAEGELGRHDEAKRLLEAALANGDEEVKLSARTELSELAGTRGDAAASIAEQRAALAEAIKIYEPFNKRHPNITAMRHDLGVVLLKHGDAAAALAELAKADDDADVAEISPLELAQLRFAHSQALAKARPGARAEARKLATSALELYAHAPDTKRFRAERAAIEAWIAKLDGR